jgi:hypothetical protein
LSAGLTALIIAAVGVIGTLVAPIVSQRLSALARREEFELQRLQRNEEHAREREKDILDNKRKCYISFTSAARVYRVELMNFLFVVKHERADANADVKLMEARSAFSVSFAEVQLTGAAPVLEAVMQIRDGLSHGYQAIRRLERDTLKPDESFDEIENSLLNLWTAEFPALYKAMRADLGIID